jgi:hypothetical protein
LYSNHGNFRWVAGTRNRFSALASAELFVHNRCALKQFLSPFLQPRSVAFFRFSFRLRAVSLFAAVCVIAAVVCVATGCGGAPSGDVVPTYNPKAASAAALKLLDSNQNGSIEAGELTPALLSAMPRIDLDGNGKLTDKEISERINFYKTQNLPSANMECLVLRRGQPVPQAKVTLVPEEFLKTTIKPAAGTTNANGRAFLATEGNNNTGVQLGLYKVQIILPDAGGAETTLGAEVSMDVPGFERGLIFELNP